MRGKAENRDFVMKWILGEGEFITVAALELQSYENWGRTLQ